MEEKENTNYQVVKSLIYRCEKYDNRPDKYDSKGEALFWDILTSLRHLDDITMEDRYSPKVQLKKLTTERIRYFLGFDNRGIGDNGGFLTNEIPLSPEQIEKRNEQLAKLIRRADSYNGHFVYHWYHAMEALQTLQYHIPEAEKVDGLFINRLNSINLGGN